MKRWPSSLVPAAASFGLALPLALASCGSAPPVGGGLPSFYDRGAARDPLADGAGVAAGELAAEATAPAAGAASPPTWGVVPDPSGAPTVASPTHSVEGAEAGRFTILELYQRVLDERDALAREVDALSRALRLEEERSATLKADGALAAARASELEARVAALEEESRDLAARLVQAQIRRLEAEKILLESKIAWQRSLEEGATEAAPAGGAGR